MLKEILIGLLSVTTLVGIVAFMIRQSIWTRYIQPLVSRKPNLSIRFEDGIDVLHLEKATPRNVEQTVVELMTKEQHEHPYEHYTEPSFQNPFPQLFEGNSSNKKIYNELLVEYLKEKETEYRNIEQGLMEDEYVRPIKLILRNDGEVGSGKINIHLNVAPKEHVYLSSCRETKIGETIEPPVCMPDGVFPLLSYKRVPYTYYQWNFANHLADEISVSVDFLNHHSKDEEVFPVIYVDTRYEQKVSLQAKIIDSSVQEPIETELIIKVE